MAQSPKVHITLPDSALAYCRRESDRMGIATGTLLRILVLEAINQRQKEHVSSANIRKQKDGPRSSTADRPHHREE